MQVKNIFTYTLADFIKELDAARKDGYEFSEKNEHYPMFINNGFYIGLVKAEKAVEAVKAEQPVEIKEEKEQSYIPEDKPEDIPVKTTRRRTRQSSE